MEPIRLLLLDDHDLFRESLSRLLASEPGITMVGHCATPGEALEILKHSPVDLALVDFDLENDRGTRFLSDASKQGYRGKTLMVTAGMNEMEASLARQLGASGIVLKHNSPATLIEAIRTAAHGGQWIDPKAVTSDHDEDVPVAAGAKSAGTLLLTEREQQVLRRVFEGLSNKEIAAHLCVSESSVKATLQQLFQKTGVRTRSQLVRIAIEWSLDTSRRTSVPPSTD